MKTKNLSFEATFSGIQQINPHVAKVSIKIGHHSKNRNRSNISKDIFQKIADKSLIFTPIIGEWSEEKTNYKGHGGKLILSDDGVEYIQTTVPFGFVDSDTEMKWETIREKDGVTEHEYLCCTGYLWYGRYQKEVDKLLNTGMGQSMELEILDGEYTDDGYFNILDANFTSLCILGRDYQNSENHVEPCFPSSEITRYALDEEDFKSRFNLMVKEIKDSLQINSSFEVDNKNTDEGGIEVENENFENEEVIETVVEEIIEEVAEKFEESETIEASEEIIIETEVVDFETIKQDYENKIADLNTEIETSKSNYSILESDFNKLKEENESLKEFKLAKEVSDKEKVFSKFDLAEEDTQELREKLIEFSCEQLEEKLFAIWGKKKMELEKGKSNFSKNNKQDKKDNLILPLSGGVGDINQPIYADIVNKHKK